MYSTLTSDTASIWYRFLNDLLWAWRSIYPIEIKQVLVCIAALNAERGNPQWLDIVVGYSKVN